MSTLAPSRSQAAASFADSLGRPLRDLRISVTDRCNFRCVYCMPKEIFGRDFQFLERSELLTFEEIARLARIFVAQGVEKLRITGGEPLVRRELERRPRAGAYEWAVYEDENHSERRHLAGVRSALEARLTSAPARKRRLTRAPGREG